MARRYVYHPMWTRTAFVPALLAACALRPSSLPASPDLVVVKTVRLPDRDWLPWFTRFAEHTWIDLARGGAWHRIEWNTHVAAIGKDPIDESRARADERWGRPVAVVTAVDGERAAAIAARVLAVATTYPSAADYRAWPGPNSNTFVEWLAREVELPVRLPPTAVGKDYTPWLRIGVPATGTGLEVETAIAGVQIGLREGVELHCFGMTAGIGLWPPSLTLPFLPAIPGGWIGP